MTKLKKCPKLTFADKVDMLIEMSRIKIGRKKLLKIGEARKLFKQAAVEAWNDRQKEKEKC